MAARPSSPSPGIERLLIVEPRGFAPLTSAMQSQCDSLRRFVQYRTSLLIAHYPDRTDKKGQNHTLGQVVSFVRWMRFRVRGEKILVMYRMYLYHNERGGK
jgi:hypothetical protein